MNEELKVTPPDYAFPQPYQECMSHLKGLTMRDYFAAKAINFIQWNSDYTTICAKRCYEIADAMMEARK